MKKFIYSIAIITLLASLTSCTADEIQPANNAVPTTINASDTTIIPPTPSPTPK